MALTWILDESWSLKYYSSLYYATFFLKKKPFSTAQYSADPPPIHLKVSPRQTAMWCVLWSQYTKSLCPLIRIRNSNDRWCIDGRRAGVNKYKFLAGSMAIIIDTTRSLTKLVDSWPAFIWGNPYNREFTHVHDRTCRRSTKLEGPILYSYPGNHIWKFRGLCRLIWRVRDWGNATILS